ncbi:MAG: DNA-protecting protein DprA [Phycisphaeraceae bacterium]|nr:DNA-protecting protein DprA [Phycisphaeraceae bacterium]
MDPAERDAMLALSLVPGLGPTRTRRCLDHFGSAATTLAAPAANLAQVQGIGRTAAESIRRAIDELDAADALTKEKSLLDQHHARVILFDDDDYPKLLRHIIDPPMALYVRGHLKETDGLSIALVGARRCTHYGREQAHRLAGLCASAGLTVVSGGAYGIDTASHRGALDSSTSGGGRTIAVLGSGLANPYPPENIDLFDRIVRDNQGAVLSELPMTAPPLRDNFPARNRIISGLSLGVLVIEAAERSGALITARLAAEEHHREVMALPGRVDSPASAGCHKMIREGWARLVTNLEDILESLGEAGQMLQGAMQARPTPGTPTATEASPNLFAASLTDPQQKLTTALADGHVMGVDELSLRTGLPPAEVTASLTILEIRGLIRREGLGFVRKR